MPHIIVIHGPAAVGKSTIVNELRQRLPNFSYVDRPNIKRGLKPVGRECAKKISKVASFSIMKELIKIKLNFIVEEVAPSDIKRKLAKQLKMHNYHVHGFYLLCSLSEALRRDSLRGTKKPRPALVRKIHQEFPAPSAHDIIIDTGKLSVNKVIKFILSEIKN